MEKSKQLTSYIKDYYNKNKSYPKTNINFYLYGRSIGQGAFGKVNLGLNILTGRVVAIKSFKKKCEEKKRMNISKILYETNLMKKFNHPNITKILEVFNDDDYMLIIMEYINGGNLFSFVQKRRKLPEKIAKFLFIQIIKGIQYIHSKNIVHRDIKLENILIDFNNQVKICDFGIGKILNSPDEKLYDKCGTLIYMAPEIITNCKNRGYKGFPVDIWSSGITLYIMLSGKLPFNDKNKSENISLNDVSKNIKEKKNESLENRIINEIPKKIKHISEDARDLINGLLNKDPNKRLTCEEILNHPWLKEEVDNFEKYKCNLFSKSELTMMSKTYIDYRKGKSEELKENFSISNLKSERLKIPFNTEINLKSKSKEESIDKFNDYNNSKIQLENGLIIFNDKIKRFNFNYEINNNKEVDNGMLIKTKTENSFSFSLYNHNNIEHSLSNLSNEGINKEKINIKNEAIINGTKGKEKNKNNLEIINFNDTKYKDILNEIENLGYKKDYVINCINNNILCHATTIFYLLNNYNEIE